MNSFKIRSIVVAALAALPAAGFALDLVGSYDKARSADPTMLAADAARLAGREKAVQGAALLKPQVSLSASLTQLDQRSSSSAPAALADLVKADGSGRVQEAGLQLVQPLYDAKAVAEKAQLGQRSELAETQHRQAEQDLLQRVGEAYFELLLADEHLRVVRSEKAAVAMQRDRAQARFDVGRGRITDLQEAQARYDGVLTKEVSAESTLAQRQAKYEALTGAPGHGLAVLRPGFTPALPDALAAWQQRGQLQSPQVQRAQQQLAIARAETTKHRLDARPTLDLVASLGYKGQSGGLSPAVAPDSSRAAAIGVQFKLPLYRGGALDSREREAVAQAQEAEQQLAAAQRDNRLQVQDAWLAVKTGVARIGALEQSQRSAQTALDATTLGRDLGNRTELDVLDAQQRLYQSQFDLAQARNDYLLGRLRLAAAAGELQRADLQTLNDQLVH